MEFIPTTTTWGCRPRCRSQPPNSEKASRTSRPTTCTALIRNAKIPTVIGDRNGGSQHAAGVSRKSSAGVAPFSL